MQMCPAQSVKTIHIAKTLLGMTRRVIVGTTLSLTLICAGFGCGEHNLLIPDPAVRYLVFGDSSISGHPSLNIPDILPELLGQPKETFANQGKGGETASAGLERLRRILSLGVYPNAHTLLYWEGGADIINLIREVDILLLFSPDAADYPDFSRLNEVLAHVQDTVETVIAEGRGAGLNVYVATYFSLREAVTPCDPLFLDIILPAQARNANVYVSLLNGRIRLAAINQGAVVVEVASADDLLHNDEANFLNCNHLSSQGNEIVARIFADTLRQGEGD